MSDESHDRLGRLEAGQARLDAGQAELKATLARLESMLVRLVDGQAEMRERMAHLEGRVEGRLMEMSARISDIYTRLPVPIAYQAPAPGKKRAS